MLKEIKDNETWETTQVYRISLSLNEIDQILHALEYDKDYPQTIGLHERLDNRLRRLHKMIINGHNFKRD